MKVFKTCLLIARRCIGILIAFCSIFIFISVFSSQMQGEKMEKIFQGEAVPYTIINRDEESTIVQGMREYLKQQKEETVIEDDVLKLQDALFYGKTDYIIIVPKGFSEAFPEQKLEIVSRPGAAETYFMDQLLENYFMHVKLQLQVSTENLPARQEKAVAAALDNLSQNVEVEKQYFGSQQEVSEGYQVYFRMVGYALIVLIFQFISSVQMVFGRKEIRMRHDSAPMSRRRMLYEIGLYGVMVSFGISLILMGIGYGMNAAYFNAGGWQRIGLIYLNEITFMLVAIAIAVLCSQFTFNETVQSVISNFVALSLSFLGGLFVPMELLSESLQNIGRLMPTYWYAETFDQINQLGYYTASAMQPVWQGILIQLCYAAAIFCVAMLVAKYKRME